MNKDNVLVNVPRVAKILKTLGNENILKILCFLSEGAMVVKELEQATGLSQSLISQNLKKCELMDIVSSKREGKWVSYEISSKEILKLFRSLHNIFCK